MKWKLALWLLVIVPHLGLSQTDAGRWSILFKGGVSDYAGWYIGDMGGGSAPTWGLGPFVSTGAEYSVTRTLRVQGVLEYASHGYQPSPGHDIYDNDPTLTIIGLSLNARWAFGFFYILSGVGLYHEHADQVGSGPLDQVIHLPEAVFVPEANTTGVAGNMSLGFSVRVSQSVDLFLEGGFQARRYTAAVAQLGARITL